MTWEDVTVEYIQVISGPPVSPNLTDHETETFGIVLIIYYMSFLHVAINGSGVHSASYSIGSRG
jgi:hypothetical protein